VETAGRPRSFSSRASRVLMLASRIRSRLNQAAASYDCTWAHQRPASLIVEFFDSPWFLSFQCHILRGYPSATNCGAARQKGRIDLDVP